MTTRPGPSHQQIGQDPRRSPPSETGGLPGEHPGRPGSPLINVTGLAWLESGKPDLNRAGRFGAGFGFTVADRTPDPAGPAFLATASPPVQHPSRRPAGR